VQDFAAHIAGQYPAAARAVLFYGSCLRSEQLEGQMLDFYLIVSDYDAAYDRKWLAKWNRVWSRRLQC
jgi:dienelactone hydrolase